MIMKNKRLFGILLTIAFLLFLPVIAGFPWTRLDYITAGILLLGTGLSCELVMRKVKKLEYKIVLCGAILGVLVLIWAAIVSSE